MIIGWFISFLDSSLSPHLGNCLFFLSINSLPPSISLWNLGYSDICLLMDSHSSTYRFSFPFKISVISFFFTVLFQNSYPPRHIFVLPSGLPCYRGSLLHSSSHSLTSSAPEFLFGAFLWFQSFWKITHFVHFIPDVIDLPFSVFLQLTESSQLLFRFLINYITISHAFELSCQRLVIFFLCWHISLIFSYSLFEVKEICLILCSMPSADGVLHSMALVLSGFFLCACEAEPAALFLLCSTAEFLKCLFVYF